MSATSNVAPNAWLNGYSCDGTNIIIPLTALTGSGLTVASANASTGDIQKIILALLYTLTNVQAASNISAPKMSFNFLAGNSSNSGGSAGVVKVSYNVQFDTNVSYSL